MAIVALPKFTVETSEKAILAGLNKGGLSEISASVRSRLRAKLDPAGRTVFNILSRGRGPVFPVRAKALRYKNKAGQTIIRSSVGPAAGVPVLQRALPSIMRFASTIQKSILTGIPSRLSMVSFVNSIVDFARLAIRDKTPVVSGRLRNSYFTRKAR